jgi:hypothetical protein
MVLLRTQTGQWYKTAYIAMHIRNPDYDRTTYSQPYASITLSYVWPQRWPFRHVNTTWKSAAADGNSRFALMTRPARMRSTSSQ